VLVVERAPSGDVEGTTYSEPSQAVSRVRAHDRGDLVAVKEDR
jgi:hypothetical protein